MRFTVPLQVVITAESAEEAEQITTAFAYGILPRYRPFSATYPSVIGTAQAHDPLVLTEDEDIAFGKLIGGLEL